MSSLNSLGRDCPFLTGGGDGASPVAVEGNEALENKINTRIEI